MPSMRILLFIFSVGCLMLGGLLLLPEHKPIEIPQASKKLPQERIDESIRDVTPEDALPGPKPDAPIIERLPQIIPAKPEKPKPPIHKHFAKPVIATSAGFVSGEKEISFSGIKAISLEKTCEDADGNSWPCGKFARTALRGLVRGRTIKCALSESEHGSRCKIGQISISQWLVANGWAYSEDPDLDAHMQKAQRLKLGIWRESRP